MHGGKVVKMPSEALQQPAHALHPAAHLHMCLLGPPHRQTLWNGHGMPRCIY